LHPADVADFVAEQVEELRRTLAGRPDLNVHDTSLDNDVQLHITFTRHERHIIQQGLPAGFAVAGEAVGLTPQSGVELQHIWRVPDLSTPPTNRTLILHLDCTNFDGQPPTGNLLRDDGSQLPAQEWPNGGNGDGIITGHGGYDRPVFCRPGLREYHQHVQHQDDSWDLHREATSIEKVAIGLLNDLRYRWLGKQ
jgi:hypothetical protein